VPGVRGLAQAGPGGHRRCWGDVDRLSTPSPGRNPRRDAASAGYPHHPHPYGKNGIVLFFEFSERWIDGIDVEEGINLRRSRRTATAVLRMVALPAVSYDARGPCAVTYAD
jgi:hypothetical protein